MPAVFLVDRHESTLKPREVAERMGVSISTVAHRMCSDPQWIGVGIPGPTGRRCHMLSVAKAVERGLASYRTGPDAEEIIRTLTTALKSRPSLRRELAQALLGIEA